MPLIKVEGTGWLGLGVAAGPGTGMVDADMLMVAVAADGSARAEDMWSASFSAPQADAALVGVWVGSQAAGVTTVTFRRPLVATDRCDRALVKDGRNNLIYAWNPSSDDMSQYHGANRGLANVQLSSSADTTRPTVDELVSDSEYTTFRTHGILMAIAFCILMPAAFLANRLKGAHFLRDSPQLIKGCFYAHIALNVSAVAVAAAGFALPFDRESDLSFSEVDLSHGSFGVAIMALLFLQAVYPWLRPAPSPLTALRRAWELLHTTLGRAILVMGLVNVALGIHIMKEEFNGSVHFFACLAGVPIASLAVIGSVVDRLSSQSANAACTAGAAYAAGGKEADGDAKAVDVK
ncbi:hypothetical protein GPECTOR_37g146 [Gonium pectorale]|uniref:Cytochrome b561 domain-containing protein n=1 Tax=Gonium pectorale TaxID=33097 RepID=A0A150GBB2_GONPE|nr:hypothetical protein GPECTOR_37g146 [Gonium pectorale]|eukprot:KXZ47141.1 hypothetical protein GPECTOR_37g146 [Gonium pectorale]